MARDAFISYSTRDKTSADELCAVLEELGLHCWMAPRDIPAGAEFEVAVLDAIDQSRAIVVVLSSSSNASPYVRIEVSRAFARQKPIFTFRIEDVAPAKALDFYLARYQWTDGFPHPVEQGIARVARALLELLNVQSAMTLVQPKRETVIADGIRDMRTSESGPSPHYQQRNVFDRPIAPLTEDLLGRVEQLPNAFRGLLFTIVVECIGQADGDSSIVNWDSGLASAAGTTAGDTLRFQVRTADPKIYVHRIHADGQLARQVVETTGLASGLEPAGALAGKAFIIECRGNYNELVLGFVDEAGEREWALIWKLVAIRDSGAA